MEILTQNFRGLRPLEPLVELVIFASLSSTGLFYDTDKRADLIVTRGWDIERRLLESCIAEYIFFVNTSCLNEMYLIKA